MNDKMSGALDKLKPKETKVRKKGVNAKSKGKTAEYYFANYLSKVTGMPFQRIFTSGASVGQSNRNRLLEMTSGQAVAQLGDITSPELIEQLIVWESKNYATVDLHLLLSKKSSKQITGWLTEMLYDVESALTIGFTDKPVLGFLLVKWTRKGSWIVFNKAKIDPLIKVSEYATPALTFQHKVSDTLRADGWNDTFVMCDFEEFIDIYHESLFKFMTKEQLEKKLIADLEREIDRVKNKTT